MGSSVSSSRPPSRVSTMSARGSIVSPSTGSSPSKSKVDQNRLNEQIKTDKRRPSAVSSQPPDDAKDVMISYSHAQKAEMLKIKEVLESHGLTVWVDISGLTAGVNFLTKIGQAVIDSKALIALLSEKYIQSRCCRDELALAYVSQKPIYPIGLQTPQDLLPQMDTGMRLQLARFDWFVVTNPDLFDENMDDFARKLRLDLYDGHGRSCSIATDSTAGTVSTAPSKERPKLIRTRTSSNMKPAQALIDSVPFWEKHFDGSDSCEWDKFKESFNMTYAEPLEQQFGITDTEWLLTVLKRELEVDKVAKVVNKEKFDAFRTVDGEAKSLWIRLQDQAIESYCMREVFNMDSSVRVEAIENLGKLKSKAVVEALLDLLEDPDNNVVTVAALSLAKTGNASQRTVRRLMATLENSDRLVRESGCLALGHMQAKEAVPKLVDLWRNDYISSVRDAAQVALKQIGGEEANKAIHITNLLAKEIRSLTE